MISEEFEQWLAATSEELKDPIELLSLKLSDDPNQLLHQMCVIETWYSRLGFLLAEANTFVDRANVFYRPAKDGEKSEMDRKIELEGRTAHYREWRDKIESLLNAIKQRIILGESCLGYHKIFRDFVVK